MSSQVFAGDTSGSITIQAPAVAGTGVLTLPENITGTLATRITSGTAVASTSGTSIEFTSIPSWVKRITVMLNSVSTSGTSLIIVQIGSTTYTVSGYLSSGFHAGATNIVSGFSATVGFLTAGGATAANIATGTTILNNISGNIWISSATIGFNSQLYGGSAGGVVTLSGVLDRVRVTTVNGTDTFDAGSINILYE